MSLYDTSEIGSVKIVMLKGQDGQGAENIFALEGAGKMTSYFGNVIDTDILMNRAPRAGDRVLVYLDSSAVTPTSIKVYGENMSDPYTIPFLSTPDYLNSLCLIRLVDMLGSVAANLDFMDEVSFTAGDGISIDGSTITNSKPQKGENIKAYTMTNAISGDLGTFDGTVDYLMISFADIASPDSSGEYTCTLSYGSTVKIGKLYDNKANGAFREKLAKGMTITVKTTGSGAGTAQDPIQMRVMAVDNGYVTAGRKYGTSASFGNRSTAEGDDNIASGNCSHAEGFGNVASGNYSHVGGSYNTAAYENQTALGKYNSNKSDTLLEVGNGTGTARSNALEVKGNGDVIAGNDVINADGYSLRAAENAISNPKTATGNPVIVEDALESNADGLVAQIVPIQSGSGDPSPENVRPISGRTEVNLGRSGKNVFDGVYPDIVANLVKYRSIAVGDGTFTISTDCPQNSANGANIFFLAGNVETGASTLGNGVWSGQTRTVTAVDGYVTVAYRSEGGVDPTNYHTQIECGSTATPYEPYTPVTLTIALGTTVYGGSLDVKTGVLTVDKAIITLDGNAGTNYGFKNYWESSTTWTKYMGRTSINVGCRALSNSYTDINAISDKFKAVPESERSTSGVITGATDTAVPDTLYLNFGEASGLDTTAKQIAWLAQNPVQVCYELATPTTIQLTGAELALLMGYNRITSDSGDITLTYKANAVMNLQNDKADNADIVDFIENGNKASRAYSANQFMLWKGDLYKVTTSIASGATITAGTNVTKTTIGAVLTALLNA